MDRRDFLKTTAATAAAAAMGGLALAGGSPATLPATTHRLQLVGDSTVTLTWTSDYQQLHELGVRNTQLMHTGSQASLTAAGPDVSQAFLFAVSRALHDNHSYAGLSRSCRYQPATDTAPGWLSLHASTCRPTQSEELWLLVQELLSLCCRHLAFDQQTLDSVRPLLPRAVGV